MQIEISDDFRETIIAKYEICYNCKIETHPSGYYRTFNSGVTDQIAITLPFILSELLDALPF